MSFNRAGFMGRLGAAPELKHTPNGVAVVTFNVAVDRDYAPEGSTKKEVDWLTCVAWRQTAEFIAKYFHKGDLIIIDSKIRTRNWENKQTGYNQKITEFHVENAYFGQSRSDSNSYAGNASSYGNQYQSPPGYTGNRQPSKPQSQQPKQMEMNYSNFTSSMEDDDDEVPF
jgi:single-strand DNA-binding protein